MTTWARLLYLPSFRRSYSSYFSSKPGGGRYFNSAKPPKGAVVSAKKRKDDPAPEAQSEKAQNASPNSGNAVANAVVEPSSTSTASPSESTPPENKNTPQQSVDLDNAFSEFSQKRIPNLSITPKDFKTHQFFSLHRPLLLINKPSSIFRSIPPNLPLFSPMPLQGESPFHKNGWDSQTDSDSYIDADAEAARQLMRALTVSKAGPTLSWENTLKHLGLDVSQDADRINLQEQFDKEWQEVLFDSTKRKRRKKMKKHKLKKRRRETRSERLRLKH